MNRNKNNSPRLVVRTQLRAGTECGRWDTDCVSVYSNGQASGHFNSCGRGYPGAGYDCKLNVVEKTAGQNVDVRCVRCRVERRYDETFTKNLDGANVNARGYKPSRECLHALRHELYCT